MNHEHSSIRFHFDNHYIPSMLRAVSDGLDEFLNHTGRRTINTTIVVTDSVEFAVMAKETNTVVVLVSDVPQEVPPSMQSVLPNAESLREGIFTCCLQNLQ